jgi:hypothetical protein
LQSSKDIFHVAIPQLGSRVVAGPQPWHYRQAGKVT